LLSCVIPKFVALGLRQNSEERRVTVGDPMTECEATNEDGDTGKDGIEQIERAHSTYADEVEERPLNAQISERLVQTLENPICAAFLLRFVGHVVSFLFIGHARDRNLGGD